LNLTIAFFPLDQYMDEMEEKLGLGLDVNMHHVNSITFVA
jgi:hypothetical protein